MQMAAAAAPTDAPAAAAAAAAPHHHPHAHAAAAAPPHPHAHAPHPHHHMPQPRWVVIPYPPPHHPMVAAPPPPPPQFVKHFAPPASVTPPPPPPSAGSGGNGGEDNRTIWVGDLQYWMDENYLHSCFGPSGEVVTIKVIRNRHSGVSEGYGFVEFYSHASAEKALQNFSGHVMPNTDRAFKLNWASYSMGEKRSELASDHSIFVGDLAVDVTDDMLLELFSSKYRSVKGAKVIIDANTGRSRGYGFVRFGDDNDKTHAMTEMNGVYCSTRQIRVGPATPRRSQGDSGSSPPRQSDSDSTNRTSRGDSGHRRNGNSMYYGTPFYGGYGYASPVPHPNMYAAAYGAYPYYSNQQLVS
ncbi:Polyadenylate-binding protein RBP47 [Dichanthelium oligosanthes]|uniref:Polyadenylate-binding protein RBP47 n=1 Tax=Dichanthelium oligosanthes TaxID=888268 RepID=A0A1E5VXH7_9POAL|nr:Polyadenylate-binding protein RBP47 [Dichanthelium oligosanthes]